MSKYSTVLYRVYNSFTRLVSRINWGRKTTLSEQDKIEIATLLATDYYIILVGSRSRLSSIIVSFFSWIKTGDWARYTHVFMNCDNITDPRLRVGYKFVEAQVSGVAYATFDDVFLCDRVCLMTSRQLGAEEWTRVIDSLLMDVGKPYDDLFDIVDNSRMSCVEVVWSALRASSNTDAFQEFDKLIDKTGNLVPQMYRDCTDFESVYEK